MKKSMLLMFTIGVLTFLACKDGQKEQGKEDNETEVVAEVDTEQETQKEEVEKVWDDGTETIDSDSMEASKGKTSANGSYSITRVGQTVKIKMNFKAKKTGMSGTGKSSFGFVILNDDWEPVFQASKGFTIGAKVPEGVNEKKYNPPLITLTGQKAKDILNEGAIVAFNVNVVSDGIGIPTSLNEWKEDIIENLEFVNQVIDLDPSEKLAKKGWVFKVIGG